MHKRGLRFSKSLLWISIVICWLFAFAAAITIWQFFTTKRSEEFMALVDAYNIASSTSIDYRDALASIWTYTDAEFVGLLEPFSQYGGYPRSIKVSIEIFILFVILGSLSIWGISEINEHQER